MKKCIIVITFQRDRLEKMPLFWFPYYYYLLGKISNYLNVSLYEILYPSVLYEGVSLG